MKTFTRILYFLSISACIGNIFLIGLYFHYGIKQSLHVFWYYSLMGVIAAVILQPIGFVQAFKSVKQSEDTAGDTISSRYFYANRYLLPKLFLLLWSLLGFLYVLGYS